MEPASVALASGWIGMLGGALSGAVIGLFFYKHDWLGGYGSFRRRMVRLGHISFFGLGILNVLAGLTLATVELAGPYEAATAGGLLLGLVAMPLCCFLSAWRMPFRHLFPVPVFGVVAGIVSILAGWSAS